MKAKAFCFFVALLFLNDATAQNLVPNPSFEDYSECPSALDGMYFVDHWYKSIQYPGAEYSQNPSPDYYNVCSTSPLTSVPNNAAGNQYPFQGHAYMGIVTYLMLAPEYIELIGVELMEPLVPGIAYHLSMRVSLAIGEAGTGWAINKLGMKLSMDEIYSSVQEPLNNFAHVFSEEVITDSLNWTLIQGTVVADEPYQFLHIGRFFNFIETEIVLLGNSNDVFSYYFIDDVRVSQDPLLSFENGIENELFQLGPNPVSEILWVRSNFKNTNAEIYDLNGKLLNSYPLGDTDVRNINVQHLNKGMYILRVTSKSGEIQTEKFIKY